jgi:hypothetical protein
MGTEGLRQRALDWYQVEGQLVAIEPKTIYGHTSIPRPVVVTDNAGLSDTVVVEHITGREDWHIEWCRCLALLSAALYFVAYTSAQIEFTDQDLLTALQENAVTATAAYWAMRNWGQRRGWK